MNFHELLANTVDGLTKGSIYALVALGYTLVYGVLKLINFAHSEIFMIGTFGVLAALNIIGVTSPFGGFGLVAVMLLCLVVGMLCSGGAAVVLEFVAYRPLRKRNASRLAALSARGAAPAASGPVWITARTMPLAAAAIQKVAGDIVAGAGGTVREVQVLQPDAQSAPAAGPLPVSAEFLLETTHAGLRRILMALAATQPVLATSALSIEALPASAGANAEVPLRVDVRITGYWQKAGT